MSGKTGPLCRNKTQFSNSVQLSVHSLYFPSSRSSVSTQEWLVSTGRRSRSPDFQRQVRSSLVAIGGSGGVPAASVAVSADPHQEARYGVPAQEHQEEEDPRLDQETEHPGRHRGHPAEDAEREEVADTLTDQEKTTSCWTLIRPVLVLEVLCE